MEEEISTTRMRSNRELISRFWPYLKRYKGMFCLNLFCAACSTVCEMILPVLVRYITDIGMNNRAALTYSLIFCAIGFYLVLRVFDSLAAYRMNAYGHIMGTKLETDMRRDLFSHLETLSFSYYDNAKIGTLMSRITNDLFEITEFAHHLPENVLITSIKIIVSFSILSTMNLPLTLLIYLCLPFMIVCSKKFYRQMRRANKESRAQIAQLNAQLEDSLGGIRVVQSFANEDVEREKFSKDNDKLLDIKSRMYRYFAQFHISVRVFDALMYAIVLALGSVFMMHGKIQPADLVAYMLYVNSLIFSVRTIVDSMELFQRGLTGIERFSELMDEKPEIEDAADAQVLQDVHGDVVFENVSFGYSENNEPVLSQIDLSVRAGENIAVVGPSGGGKTTLCSLLPRFYEVTSGRILIDGKDIKKLTLSSLRNNIGVVRQDVYMFSGTIAENIAYGLPGAPREAIVEAAKKAGAHEFIADLPNGYDTYVGERGVKLSGGQKQRISIARVFLKNPPILILDEATSALDNESERVVQKSLTKLSEGRTTFTIAHRLSTVRSASRILVLTADGIAESGTRDELMAKKGIYYELETM